MLQVLTSETTATGADLVCWLRARWRIENMVKYAPAHNGIDALACYEMDIGPDTRKVANPARAPARTQVRAAQGELVAAKRALPQPLAGEGSPKQINAALPAAHDRIARAQHALVEAKDALGPIPAKIAATELDPNATQARPHLARRARHHLPARRELNLNSGRVPTSGGLGLRRGRWPEPQGFA